jgi:hypothetical protein
VTDVSIEAQGVIEADPRRNRRGRPRPGQARYRARYRVYQDPPAPLGAIVMERFPMKTIMLITLLAAAGCGGKKTDNSAEPSAACADSINKGMDGMTAALKARGSNAEVPEALLGVLGKLRTALTERCTQDQWSSEALACYKAVTSQPEVRACQAKLTQDQRTKLSAQLRQVMMGGAQMPPGMSGHPPALQGAGSSPPGGPPAATPGAAADPGAPAGSAAAPTRRLRVEKDFAPTGSATGSAASGSAASGW